MRVPYQKNRCPSLAFSVPSDSLGVKYCTSTELMNKCAVVSE